MGVKMVEKVSSEQAYINYVMKNLPEVERGDVHIMQKGDNLWNLAKKALNKKDATNQEISDYMLLIAKLNNLETVEKMNGLKVSDIIYMPESSAVQSVSLRKSSSAKARKAEPKPQTSAEISVLKLKETILNDKTVFTEKAYPRSLNLYHVYNNYYNKETGYHSYKHPLMTVKVDKEGNISRISFDDTEKSLNPIKYDYDMDAKGNIVIDNFGRKTPVGKIDAKQLDELKNILQEQIERATPGY